jgi:hypothetical protein
LTAPCFGVRVLRRGFDKYVDMVFCHFHGIYIKIILFSYVLEDVFYVSSYIGIKYKLTVFGNPDDRRVLKVTAPEIKAPFQPDFNIFAPKETAFRLLYHKEK